MAEEHLDPFTPVLRNAVTPFAGTEEQEKLIDSVLQLSSSDSRFAQKASTAIKLILVGGVVSGMPPVITSLEPNTKAAGSPTFKLKVKGIQFDATCKIYVNDVLRTTTFTSATEVSTDISLVGVTGANVYPVVVVNGTGATSNTLTFTVTAA